MAEILFRQAKKLIIMDLGEALALALALKLALALALKPAPR